MFNINREIHVVEINERIIDCLDFNIWVLQSISEYLSSKSAGAKDKERQHDQFFVGRTTYNTPDTAESIDSDIDSHSEKCRCEVNCF